ncbi:magnesium/cobalt transporter CorA [Candidatus Thorarchaeota archaeon]|nr:MAG: magnesium/cobalt transporter CorA [Candidatus Thorarchaeota archaeon]
MSEDEMKGKVGLAPGTVIHTGLNRHEEVKILITEFSEGQYREYEADSIDDCSPIEKEDATKWIHVMGVHDIKIVENICSFFDVHPLVVEDIPSIGQRPKIEAMPNGVFTVLREYNIIGNEVHSEQVSIVFGKGYIISFQESSADIFDPIRVRVRQPRDRIRNGSPDYLAYTLLDLIVDKYFVVLEYIGDTLEDLEDDLIEEGSADMLTEIYKLKRILLAFRRHIWPLRHVVLKLQRDVPMYVCDETQIFLRDLYDHVIRVTDHIETYRESITGMLDIYLSRMSNKMNEVMQVLTVISVIFIPLTLMASVYGMNWQWIPELEFYYGYPVFMAFMLIVGLMLLAYFRRIGWV